MHGMSARLLAVCGCVALLGGCTRSAVQQPPGQPAGTPGTADGATRAAVKQLGGPRAADEATAVSWELSADDRLTVEPSHYVKSATRWHLVAEPVVHDAAAARGGRCGLVLEVRRVASESDHVTVVEAASGRHGTAEMDPGAYVVIARPEGPSEAVSWRLTPMAEDAPEYPVLSRTHTTAATTP